MNAPSNPPARIIHSMAPIRICDNGGWTDTWFARHGAIFNVGVAPHAEAQISVRPRDNSREHIIIRAENYGERYALPTAPNGWLRHPLLEAAIARMGVPDDVAVEITIFSEAPAGASTGTSAAVAVALVGALARLRGQALSAHDAAYTAHALEVEMLQRQSGIQDQLCSAYGGVNYIEMTDYPHATVTPLELRAETWWELERRLLLIFLGRTHDSSQIHERVIAQLANAGPDCRQLNDLRVTAAQSRDAVLNSDWRALGRAMIANTEAQARLHPELVSADAQRVIEIARAHHALGWKVNGAGGEGGSLTLLTSARSHEKRALVRAIEQESILFQNIPIALSGHGLRVWETSND